MKLKSLALIAVLLVSTLAAALSPVGAATQNTSAKLDTLLTDALAKSTAPVEAIVTFRGNNAPSAQQIDLLKQVGIISGVTLKSLPMAGVLVTADQVQALSKLPEVRSIYLNKKLKYDNYDATALTGVDRVRADASMTQANKGLPVSGKGVTVVVNDSGVDGTHKDIQYGTHLIENATGSTNLHSLSDLLPITYLEGVPNTDTNSGHGTHVTGTVGGTGAMSALKYEGVAPGANLVGYGSGAALLILDAVGGFDYALTNQSRFGIRIITNSWGSSGGFDPEDPVNIASKLAYDRGIVVTFAAGNEGPGEDTLNPYSKAPWVISVAAGDKQGKLADFSSRGVSSGGGTFTVDGETWTWVDRPTITAPGVDIISTRALAPVSSLSATDDANQIEPAYLPFYTLMSGTSMATPHAAGIVALMLEANPSLSPAQVKQILQNTATNMPGMEPWEVGAGYVNAYAAVDRSFQERNYGTTLNLNRSFNSSVQVSVSRTPFVVDYNPVTLASSNKYPFTVPAGLTELAARIDAAGVLDSGNPVNLVLTAPDGTEYSSGVNLLFPLYYDRTVSVTSPKSGNWTLEVRGLRGAAENPTGGAGLPEQIPGTLTFKTAGGFTGLNDITGHPAESAIKLAVNERLVDGYSDKSFKPNEYIQRREMANYLVMGAGIRQFLPRDGSISYPDVSAADRAFVEAVTAKGAAIRDGVQIQKGVMTPTAAGTFSPNDAVRRVDLAYSFVQSLGLQQQALDKNGTSLTVQYGTERIAIEDAADIPAELRGYVQVALDMNILNAYFTVTQGPYDLKPTVHATFNPTQKITRGDYAVAATRFYSSFLMP
jgi:serine protease AprX